MIISKTYEASLTCCLFFLLQICGQVQHGDRKRDSVTKGELGYSQQAEEQDKEVEGRANTRSGSASLDSTSTDHRLLQLPSKPTPGFWHVSRVLATLGIRRWKDDRQQKQGRKHLINKTELRRTGSSLRQKPYRRNNVGWRRFGVICWTLFELNNSQRMPRKYPFQPRTWKLMYHLIWIYNSSTRI